jgi:hypothetical protein
VLLFFFFLLRSPPFIEVPVESGGLKQEGRESALHQREEHARARETEMTKREEHVHAQHELLHSETQTMQHNKKVRHPVSWWFSFFLWFFFSLRFLRLPPGGP